MTQPKYAESRACDDAVPHDAHTWLDWSETLDGTFGDPPPAEYACPGVTPASAATASVGRIPTACTGCSTTIRECRYKRLFRGFYCCPDCEHHDVRATVRKGRIDAHD